MRSRYDKPIVFHQYDSVEQLLEKTEEQIRTVGRLYRRWKEGVRIADSYDFIGRKFDSFDHVLEESRKPWQEGIEVVEGMIRELQDEHPPAPKSHVRRARFNPDNGDEVDHDRLRSGQDYWRKTEREVATGTQNVTLIFNSTSSQSVHWKDVMWKGAAAMVLADMLEQNGYRVQIVGSQYEEYESFDGAGFFQVTTLKGIEQPTDIATLVTAISGWFYRTVLFQSHYNGGQDSTFAFSRPGTLTENNPQDENGDPYIPQLFGKAGKVVIIDGVWDRSAASRLIRDTIEHLQDKESE